MRARIERPHGHHIRPISRPQSPFKGHFKPKGGYTILLPPKPPQDAKEITCQLLVVLLTEGQEKLYPDHACRSWLGRLTDKERDTLASYMKDIGGRPVHSDKEHNYLYDAARLRLHICLPFREDGFCSILMRDYNTPPPPSSSRCSSLLVIEGGAA